MDRSPVRSLCAALGYGRTKLCLSRNARLLGRMQWPIRLSATRKGKARVALLQVVLTLWWFTFVGSTAASTQTTVLVLPFHVSGDEGLQDLEDFGRHLDKRLRAALGSLGPSVTALTPEAAKDMLGARGVSAPKGDQEAQETAALSKCDYVVYGFLNADSSRRRMTAKLWDVRSGKALVSTDLSVSNVHGLPGVLEVFAANIARRIQGTPKLPFYRSGPVNLTDPNVAPPLKKPVNLPKNTGPWRSPDLHAAINAVDVGDVDGDGKNETILVEDGLVTISRFDSGALTPLAQFSHPPASYIYGEVADVNGDGIAEILLTYRLPDRIESSVVSYAARKLEIIGVVPHAIIGVIPSESGEGEPVRLTAQKLDVENIFSGDALLLKVDKQGVSPAGAVRLPPGTLLWSYASGRMGPNQPIQAVLDQDQRLLVFDRDNNLLHEYPNRVFGIHRRIAAPTPSGPKDLLFPGRLLIASAGPDAENELLVTKTVGGGSVVEALGWNGVEMTLRWKTVPNPGTITDFRIRDFKNQGALSLVLLLVRANPLWALTGGMRSVLYAYDMEQ